jgi:hypothetical protein
MKLCTRETELCFPFYESESEWGRSDSVNGLRLPTFYYVQGRSFGSSACRLVSLFRIERYMFPPKLPGESLRHENPPRLPELEVSRFNEA